MASRPPSPGGNGEPMSFLSYSSGPYIAVAHDPPTSPPTRRQSSAELPSMHGRHHNSLDIVLSSESLFLRGTGADVEPCMLGGTVVLNLVEATTFKEITMQFRGKSRVPSVQSDGTFALGSSYQSNTFFTHDWSFLDRELTHTPTLKAGRHVFPFQLQLGGSLPSSISIHGGLGGINYKLRATAVRGVFASNLHAACPVRIARSFATDSLEYQQTLEVENTWPEKMMYSLMVPHKAWAAGDTISTLAKFSPLLKGVRITSITSTVHELMKTFAKSGPMHEESRVISTAKHEIRNGRTVTQQLNDHFKETTTVSRRPTPQRGASGSTPTIPDGVRTPPPESSSYFEPSSSYTSPVQQIISVNGTLTVGTPDTEAGPSSALGSPANDHTPSYEHEDLDIGEEEIVTTLPLTLPVYSTPTHGLEPVVITHRIRWSILMSNPDGHTSELRCSLPLHVLDHTCLYDARAATRVTRRLLFGLEDAQPHNSPDELELPSYPAHVLDRVANAYINAIARTSNPWVSGGTSPTGGLVQTPLSEVPTDVPLDLVNSELHRLNTRSRSGSAPVTPPESTPPSQYASRASSRAGSPERGGGNGGAHRTHHSIFSLKPFSKVASSFHSHGPSRQLSTDQVRASGSGLSHPLAIPAVRDTPLLARNRSEDALRSVTYSAVPDYNVASRGFLGGGITPLSSMRGLPSYEEAERSQSDGDLAVRFAAAAAAARTGT
ncbi:hypothetical protein K439DRAFT_1632192 [Ramaria rubella]|nr:hypothetical protein K439DRAFT_1632192 [Ramaria rubella]